MTIAEEIRKALADDTDNGWAKRAIVLRKCIGDVPADTLPFRFYRDALTSLLPHFERLDTLRAVLIALVKQQAVPCESYIDLHKITELARSVIGTENP